jgi:hypothetical protein
VVQVILFPVDFAYILFFSLVRILTRMTAIEMLKVASIVKPMTLTAHG